MSKGITLAQLQAMIDSGQLILPAGHEVHKPVAKVGELHGAELHGAAPVPLTPQSKPEVPVQHIPMVPAPNIQAEMDGTALVVTLRYDTTSKPIKQKGQTSMLIDTQRFISLGQGYGLLAKLTFNPSKV